MLSQSQVLFVTSEMQTKLHCFSPKVLSMIDVHGATMVSFISRPCVFARTDVISFHGELKVLKGRRGGA